MLRYKNNPIKSETDSYRCPTRTAKPDNNTSIIKIASRIFTAAISTLLLTAFVSCGASSNEPMIN